MDSSLRPFFDPRGVAVVGVSHDPGKLGHALARNLIHSGYRGAIHLVNPRGGRLFDRPVYPDLAAVPDPVDLAVLIVPAAAAPQALRACARRGVYAVIIPSGGFRETGPAGAALEAECTQTARDLGLRLIGPNCIGVLDTHLPLDTTFLPPPPPVPGPIAVLSQSGAICEALIDWSRDQGFGLSRLVSLGNQADVSEAEMLAPLAEDEHTRVLALYLEGMCRGRQFVLEAGRVARRKPIVALKVGRSAAGRRAAASHTGALAGSEAAYDAAFRKAGVIRADTCEEMFDWARALAWCPPLAGRQVAVLTNGGGPGAIAADALEVGGLRLATLAGETTAALGELLPPAASLENPVDLLGTATAEQYGESLRRLLADPGVHGVLVILLQPPACAVEAVAEALIPVIRDSGKPVVVTLTGGSRARQAADLFRAAHVPDYAFAERAAAGLAILAQRAETLARPSAEPARLGDVQPEAVRRLLSRSNDGAADGFLGQAEVGRLLAAYGVRLPRLELARTAAEAAALAHEIGFPVALKVASPDIPHKSDVGGVLLGVPDGAAAAQGFAGICRNALAAFPTADIQGVHVQPMLPAGQEVIVGAVQDPQFGPLVMFGSGGVEVEGLGDVAFALAPLSRAEAEALLDETWAGRRLRGYRNLPPADREAVLETVLRLAQLAADFPEIAEIEINPLRALPAGQGAAALDARVRLRQEASAAEPQLLSSAAANSRAKPG